MANLNVRAWFSLFVLALVMGAVLFVSAGTLDYWQAWVYLLLFFGLGGLITADLAKRDPALLERRLKGGPTAESRPLQRFLMAGASLGFTALHIVPALDHRFHWSSVPLAAVILGDVMFAVGFGFVGVVYRVNTFTSATVGVAEGQHVVSTGPYAVVRHPMYASALLYLAGTPLALASWWGYLALACFMPFLIARLYDEEKLLAQELPGYTDYMKRVRYRLIPYIW